MTVPPGGPLPPDAALRFRPDLLVSVLPGEGVVLCGESGTQVLTAPLFEAVAGLVDGTRTADDIVDAMSAHEPVRVYFAVEKLKVEGYLLAGGAHWEPEPAARPEDLADAARDAVSGLREPLALAFHGDVPEKHVRALLEEIGLPHTKGQDPPGGRDGAAVLVFTDDYLHPALKEHNRSALASGTPWFLARPVGSIVWAGPWFVPGAGPCWTCLGHRLLRNQPVRSFLAVRAGSSTLPAVPAVWTPDSLRAGVYHAVAALGGAGRHTRNATEDVDDGGGGGTPAVRTRTHGTPETAHPVHRRPQCPACGDPDATARLMAQEPTLSARPKRFTLDGGHRARTPEETVASFQSLVSPVSGVVDRIAPARLPGWEGDPSAPMHLFIAGGNHAGPTPDLALFRQGLRTWSGGKGVTEAQARASALGEAVERYCGVFQGDEPRRTGSLTSMGDDAVHPNTWMHFSDRQYAERERWNAHPSPYARVPLPFDPDAEMAWSPVWSLTHGTQRWLPTASLFYRYPGEGGAMCVADSNGAAAGNTVEEAILQGFMELVERDAVALWWYNRVCRPAVDLSALSRPYAVRLQERYRQHGRELWVLDLTTDLGIPCCAAVSRRAGDGHQQILLGLGAHFDPEIAVTRALTEVNQMLSAVATSGAKLQEEPTATWLREATLDDQPYLAPADAAPVDLRDRPRIDTDDLLQDVEVCRRRVEERDLEFLVQTQTRPDVGVPVVRVIVPGLRHFRPRFFPGRLYDVPVTLRWSDEPTAEDAMNPIPFFL